MVGMYVFCSFMWIMFAFASSYVSYVSLFTSKFVTNSSKVHCPLSNQIGQERISTKSFKNPPIRKTPSIRTLRE